ncbi:MAG: DUF2062 domain-containing protein [Kiritimatiellae bacterium]|nr:DUF2062 domain-containing protein [Kiritimatiellia bacterium]
MKTFFAKLRQRIVNALKQGWSPSAVCWSAGWGVTIGVFPIYGVTTAALAVIGWIWKLNHSILQGFNYLVTPLKFILIIPYIRLGEWMFQTQSPFRLSIPEFTRRFQAAPLQTLSEFAMTFVHAICGWLLSAPLWMLVIYVSMRILIKTGEVTRTQLQEIQ